MRWTALGVALVGAMVIAWHIEDAKARRELAAARAALAAHGFPMRLEEITPPPVPEEENADALLHEAWRIVSGSADWEPSAAAGVFARIERIKPTFGSSPASGLAPDVLARLHVLIADPQFVAFEAAMATAAQRRRWNSAIDYTAGQRGSDPAYRPVRTCISLLLLAAEIHARQPEERSAAWRNLAAARQLADWIGEPPTLVHLYSGNYCRNAVAATLVRVIAEAGAAEHLQEFMASSMEAARDPIKGYERALHGERLMILDWFTELFVDQSRDWAKELAGGGGLPTWAEWLRPWLSPVMSAVGRPQLIRQLAHGYALHLEYTLAIAKGGPTMFGKLEAITVRARSAENLVARGILASHEPFARRLVEGCAEQRALVVLLTAWRFHDVRHIWPENVEALDLPLSVIRDPCSGHAIRLAVTPDELLVYAHGFDGDDDGGRPIDPSSSTRDGDIACRARLPAIPAE